MPPAEDLSLVIGHSAGGARAHLEYASWEGPPPSVVLLNSPTNSSQPNVVNVNNKADPTSWIADLSVNGHDNTVYVETEFTGLFPRAVHDKNRSFAQIRNQL